MSRSQHEDDIYDFDNFLDKQKGKDRRGQSFTNDQYGNIGRFNKKTMVNETKLSPACVGQSPSHPNLSDDLLTIANDRKIINQMGKGPLIHVDRYKLAGPRYSQKISDFGYFPYYTNPDTIFDQATHSGKNFNRVAAAGSKELSNAITQVPVSKKLLVPFQTRSHTNDDESYSNSWRREKNRKQLWNQDTSIRKPATPLLPKDKQALSDSEFSANIDREAKEEMEKKFVALDKKMNELKNECRSNGARNLIKNDSVGDFLRELDDMLLLKTPQPVKTGTRQAVSKVVETGTRHTFSKVDDCWLVPRITKEPLKQWNGQTAIRGLGFKSKLNKEEPIRRRTDDDVIPDRVRKQMEERYKGSANI